MRAKLVHARAVLENWGRHVESESTPMEWHKGYAKALEEVLDLDGCSLRRYPRWEANISAEISRMVRSPFSQQKGAHGQIADLSVRGCRLVTPMDLSVGAVIGLSFRLPEKSTTVTLHGLICRIQRVDKGYMAAVEFIGLPEHVAGALGVTLAPGPCSPLVNPEGSEDRKEGNGEKSLPRE